MKTKHTPGEWKASKKGTSVVVDDELLGEKTICHVTVKFDPAEDVSNFKLIIAAPKLLNALNERTYLLEKILFAMENSKNVETILGFRDTIKNALSHSKDVMTKAIHETS